MRVVLSRNLIAYLASRFCAAAAMTMLRAGIAWHVFSLTGSAFHLGLIGLVQFVPAFALVLIGGAVADVYDRRRVMMVAQVVSLVAASALLVAAARGPVALAGLYAVVVVGPAAGAFDSPARASLLPTILPCDA